MPTRTFAIAELAALGIPPDSPDDIEYSDHLFADEPVTTQKYTALRRVIFRAEDDGRIWAVEYETAIDAGDYEIGEPPDDHGWHGDTVEAVEVQQQPVTVFRWVPIEDDPARLDDGVQ
ncbi:hypothetical protein [Streptomyces aureoversilis]|uniref:Uncharacterized protein n=1 Tax=Streptomyces aureoversilis TaxID=67277 RepID=A0ABV9ZVS6_9ACTN